MRDESKIDAEVSTRMAHIAELRIRYVRLCQHGLEGPLVATFQTHLRVSKQKLFLLLRLESGWNQYLIQTHVSDSVGVPATEEDRLRAINHTLLWSQRVDCVWPEMCDQFDDRGRAPNNSAMGAVVYCQLEGSQLGLRYTAVLDQLLLSSLLMGV